MVMSIRRGYGRAGLSLAVCLLLGACADDAGTPQWAVTGSSEPEVNRAYVAYALK